MTMPAQTRCTCAVCGATSEQTILASTNTMDTPDLDQRPAEMMRSSMSFWLHECPFCGYISDELSDNTFVTQQWLQSRDYRECSGIRFSSGLANRFYRQYLINLEDKNPEMAFQAALRCAWVCDDCGDSANAVRCRLLALLSLEEALTRKPGNEDLLLVRADLLRRAGMFQKLQTEYANTRFSSSLKNDILAFQLEKARQLDTACYTVRDVQHPYRSALSSGNSDLEGITYPLDLLLRQSDIWTCPACFAGNRKEHRRCTCCGTERKL